MADFALPVTPVKKILPVAPTAIVGSSASKPPAESLGDHDPPPSVLVALKTLPAVLPPRDDQTANSVEPISASRGPCIGHDMTMPSDFDTGAHFEKAPPPVACADHISRMLLSLLRNAATTLPPDVCRMSFEIGRAH